MEIVNDLSKKSVLVKVKIKSYGGRVEDKAVTNEIHSSKRASDDAGKYTKPLLSGKGMLKKIQKIQNKIRGLVYQYGLPWTNDNFYIVPTGLYQKLLDEINAHMIAHDQAVEDFLNAYDYLKDIDKLPRDQGGILGDMYDEGAYPAVEELRKCFAVQVITHPVPTAEDFRCTMSEQQINDIKKSMSQELKEVHDQAMQKVWQRVTEPLERLRDNMNAYNEGKITRIYDSVINNIVDIVDILPELNLAEDKNLEEMAKDIKQGLLRFEPQDLKGDSMISEQNRKEAANMADDILKKVGSYMPK